MTSAASAKLIWLLPACAVACAPVAEQPTGTRMVDAAAALVLPRPGGQSIVGVVERRYANALEQDVALATQAATPGQNLLEVRFLGLARAKGDDAIVPTEMTETTIAAEMQAALPGVVMTPSAAYAQNAYGPFGFATGTGRGSDVCLYGWQRIEGDVSTPLVRQGAIDLRLRVCQAGARERDLLAQMYGFTVRTPFGHNWSVGEPVAILNAALGASGAPIYPVGLAEHEAPVARRAKRVAGKPQPAPTELAVSSAAIPIQASSLPGPNLTAVAPRVPGPGAVTPLAGTQVVPGMSAAVAVPIVPAPPMPLVAPDLTAGVFR